VNSSSDDEPIGNRKLPRRHLASSVADEKKDKEEKVASSSDIGERTSPLSVSVDDSAVPGSGTIVIVSLFVADHRAHLLIRRS